LAVGVCLDKGLIHGLDDSVEYYLEDFKGTGLTIREVMQMRTNFNFDEKYGDPFGFVARAYYGKDQRKVMNRYKIVGQPGTKWEYLSGNTLILSMLVEKVSGQTIADFVSEHIWQHIGPEQPALWNMDETGRIKSFCCFISTARDFARFGKLVMARGYWNGKQIISPEFIDEMLRPVMVRDGEGNMVDYYGMQWWLGHYRDQDFFYMRGMLGQYVICFPESDLIIVRLGHQRSKEKINNIPTDMYGVMDAGWSIFDQRP
jgi:CubicO group peptidase (beta-lactamase class C family)